MEQQHHQQQQQQQQQQQAQANNRKDQFLFSFQSSQASNFTTRIPSICWLFGNLDEPRGTM